MSGSDRGKFRYTGLAITLIVSALITVLIFSIGLQKQSDLYSEASRNASLYSKNAKDSIAVKCIALTGQARTDCSNKIEDAARANERDEYDLYSQRAMALWTAIMGGMAVIGVSLSGVGVYLIWQTWGETKLAASTSQKTYTAFVDLERPRVVIEIGHDALDTSGPFKLTVQATNIGKSLAYLERLDICWRDDDAPFEQNRHRQRPIGICLKNGETETIWTGARPKQAFNVSTFLGGTVFYRSPFSPEHKTYFIEQYIPVVIGDDKPIIINYGDPRAKWPEDT